MPTMVSLNWLLLPAGHGKEYEGEWNEPSTSIGGYAEGCVCVDVGWQAQKVGGRRAVLCRVGDLSYERLARRSESDLRLAVQQLVRADHSAFKRRRQNVGTAGHEGRRANHYARGNAQGGEQQVCL